MSAGEVVEWAVDEQQRPVGVRTGLEAGAVECVAQRRRSVGEGAAGVAGVAGVAGGALADRVSGFCVSGCLVYRRCQHLAGEVVAPLRNADG
jgi:hypothetical protein